MAKDTQLSIYLDPDSTTTNKRSDTQTATGGSAASGAPGSGATDNSPAGNGQTTT